MVKNRERKPRLNFDALKSVADFGTVLEHYDVRGELSLKGSNTRSGQISMRCPFHDDDNPSLSVNRDKGIFNCHAESCGRHGNVLDFVLAMEVMAGRLGENDVRQAGECLAEIIGFDVSGQKTASEPRRASQGAEWPKIRLKAKTAADGDPGKSEKASEPELEVNKPLSASFLERFRATLVFDHPYLRERGLDTETAQHWGIGFQTAGGWQNRVVIPITDEAGEILAYAGRWALGDETIPPGEGKYKLPSGRHFNKKLALFNQPYACQARHVSIVEGYFGALHMRQLGLPAIALMGNSISPVQVALLNSFPNLQAATVLLDGGAYNQATTDRLLGIIARHNPKFRLRALALPEGAQPDTVEEAWFIAHYPSITRHSS
jgi:DNA primase